MTNVHKSNIILFSTPRFREGLFYNLYMDGENPDINNVISFDWTKYDTTKFLSTEIDSNLIYMINRSSNSIACSKCATSKI